MSVCVFFDWFVRVGAVLLYTMRSVVVIAVAVALLGSFVAFVVVVFLNFQKMI